jgi:hypothetical protein
MNLLTLHTDADFADAIVPAGMLLIFYALTEGKVTRRYKDENGNYGSL